MTLFKGVGAAMVTPFDQDGIDHAVLDNYIEHLISGGVAAVIPFGTTGEPSNISTDEYAVTLKHIVARVGTRVPVIAGAGSNSTAAAAEKAALAAKCGADGVLVVTPYYNKCTQNGIIEHYKAVAAAANIPVIAYNVPSRTGVNIAPATLQRLAEIKGICGIKEASGDISQIQQTASVCADTGLAMYSGDDGLTTIAMALGASGVISVAANPAPSIMSKIVSLCENNDFAAARKIQFDIAALVSALFCEVNPIPVKKAMQLLGFNVGAPRLPLTELEPEHTALLEKAMHEVGLL